MEIDDRIVVLAERTAKGVAALRLILDAVVVTIRECGADGAPGGPLYAALMPLGVTLATFEILMSAAVASGRVVRRGQVYYAAEAAP